MRVLMKLGHIIYKGDKLISVSIRDLEEIIKEEQVSEENRIYRPVALSWKWLEILGFTAKKNPITKMVLFVDSSGLQIRHNEERNIFCLGYTLREESGNFRYEPQIEYLNEVFDAFQLLKRITFRVTTEQIAEIEKQLL